MGEHHREEHVPEATVSLGSCNRRAHVPELEVFLRRVLEAVVTLQAAKCGRIEIFDPGTRHVALAIVIGADERSPAAGGDQDLARADSSACGSPERRPGFRGDVTDHAPEVDACCGETDTRDPRLVWSAPLLTPQGDLVGLLSTHVADGHRPNKREARLVDLCVRLAADAVREAQCPAPADNAREQAGRARYVCGLHAEPSRVAAVEWDADERVIGWSPEAERVFGWPASEVLGKKIEDLAAPDGGEASRAIEAARAASALRALRDVFARLGRREDGRAVHCEWHGSRRLDDDGNELCAYARTTGRDGDVEALESLRDINSRNDEFLAMLAHELRNPLAPIQNSVELLRALGPDDVRSAMAREVIARQVSHLTRVIDDLLDVSRISRGNITLRKELSSLSQILEQAIEQALPMIERRAHTLVLRLSPAAIYLEADGARLTQVIGNLLSNAAKFTAEGGTITVESGHTREGDVFVRIRDTGIGIPGHLLEKVFDPFVREDDELARAEGGLGVGLTLVKQLVDLHGGRVELKSEGRGTGVEVVVTLPEPRLPVRAEPAAADGAACAPVRPLRVLIVEDSPDAADSFCMLLELVGHDVRVARCGTDALRLLDEFVPEIALMDIGLPGMNGFELAERLRTDPRTVETIMVAVTGYGQEQDKRRARAAGFDHHMTKPVDMAELTSLMRTCRESVLRSRGSWPYR